MGGQQAPAGDPCPHSPWSLMVGGWAGARVGVASLPAMGYLEGHPPQWVLSRTLNFRPQFLSFNEAI